MFEALSTMSSNDVDDALSSEILAHLTSLPKKFLKYFPEILESDVIVETSECYIRIIQDMYDGATTTVRSAAGLTEEFKVGVGLHQGSALSPFLFAIIIDRLTEDIRKDAPWDMLFADDIVDKIIGS